MAILNVRDALDYIRLCDGDEDLRHAVQMVESYYTDLKERHDALRASFATEVKNAYDGEMQKRDDEIKRLCTEVALYKWRHGLIHESMYAHPEDGDDT